MVLEGCNGDVVGAIEQCLSVDEARKASRRSICSSESGSSGVTTQVQTQSPTSPAEFFRNLTTTAQANPVTGRSPLLPTFPHYMVRVLLVIYLTLKSKLSRRHHCSFLVFILAWPD